MDSLACADTVDSVTDEPADLSPAELAALRQRFQVQERAWVSSGIEYEGRGRATFVSNPGRLEGRTVVRYLEDGRLDAFEMADAELVSTDGRGKDFFRRRACASAESS